MSDRPAGLTWLVKLGGSILTDKTRESTLDRDGLERMIREIESALQAGGLARGVPPRLILVHGAGSFGHFTARHQGTDSATGATRVQSDVRRLHAIVHEALVARSLPIWSCPASNIARYRNGRIVEFQAEPFLCAWRRDAIALTGGDIAFEEDPIGFAVCSGDDLMVELAKVFEPSRIVFVTDVDGVYDHDPRRDPQSKLLETLRPGSARELADRLDAEREAAIASPIATDVTGDIRSKLRAAARIADAGLPTRIVSGKVDGRLRETLLEVDLPLGTMVRPG